MRSLLLICAVALLGPAPGQAQTTMPAASRLPWEAPEPEHDFRQRLLLALDLTASQRDSLQSWRQHLQWEMAALRDQVDGGEVLAEEGRLRYRELLDIYRDARDSILTPDQRQLVRRAQDHERQQALQAGQPERAPSQTLIEALELTEAQQERWLTLLDRLREQVRQREKAGELVTSTFLRTLREEHELAFEAILTPEQSLALEQLRLRRARSDEQDGAADAFHNEPELPDEAPVESYEDGWESLESELGEDLPE